MSESINAREGIKTKNAAEGDNSPPPSESINAREGIKTAMQDHDCSQRAERSESINAREGIKTDIAGAVELLAHLGMSESINAREGIKTSPDHIAAIETLIGSESINAREGIKTYSMLAFQKKF